jgi:hypothetical protein
VPPIAGTPGDLAARPLHPGSDVEDQEYMRTALAKGLKDRQITRHELRGALTPIVTMYGWTSGCSSGSMIIEIFDIPGLGLLLLNFSLLLRLPRHVGHRHHRRARCHSCQSRG